MTQLEEDMAELSSAEDFLNYFSLEYDAVVVQVNRLHILQRYHDYLQRARPSMPQGEAAQRDVHRVLLQRAYQDFVDSTPLQEKVFKVLKDAAGESFVPLTSIEGATEQ